MSEKPFIASKEEILNSKSLNEFFEKNNSFLCNKDELAELVERGLFYGTSHEKFTSLINPYSKNPSRIDYLELVENVKEQIHWKNLEECSLSDSN